MVVIRRFNQYIGRETLLREYKEFTLNMTGLQIEDTLAESLCMSGKFVFNDYVDRNIAKYIQTYIPKYTTAFFNPRSNIRSGKLFIGVNDMGLVKGIPYIGSLNKNLIKEKLYNTIKKNVVSNNFSETIQWTKFIKIKIITVEKPDEPNEICSPLFINFMETKNRIHSEYLKYREKLFEWRTRINFYNQKLTSLVNNWDTRKALIDYIRHHDASSPVINLLLTDYKMESYPPGYLMDKTFEPDDPYYWVTKWKDEYISIIKNERPVYNPRQQYPLAPINLLSNVSEMIPYWSKYNSNLNLFLIKIRFNNPMINCEYQYYDTINKNWTQCYRTLYNNEPACVPIK